MKLWQTLFIGTYVLVYGSVSLVLLGSWIQEVIRDSRVAGRPADELLGRRGALVGATVLASAFIGLCVLAIRGFA
jgi:hypothetical protein